MFRIVNTLGYSPCVRTILTRFTLLFTVIHPFRTVIPALQPQCNPLGRRQNGRKGAEKVIKREQKALPNSETGIYHRPAV